MFYFKSPATALAPVVGTYLQDCSVREPITSLARKPSFAAFLAILIFSFQTSACAGGDTTGGQELAQSNSTEDPRQKALSLGLHPGPSPGQTSPYSPFVRLIRNGGAFPIDVRACVRAEVISGAGILKIEPSRREANPYPYTGLEMKLANGRTEYIEAGLGFSGRDPALGPHFRPYIRRAPDTEKIGNYEPPAGWQYIKRAGQELPGYWAADEKDTSRLMALDSQFCYSFSLDTSTNTYKFEYEMERALDGSGPHRMSIEMPSARKLFAELDPEAVKITHFEARILTSVAITANDYSHRDPMYKNTVFGARWKAAARNQTADGSEAWEPFNARAFRIANYDPTNSVIYYALEKLTPEDFGFLPWN